MERVRRPGEGRLSWKVDEDFFLELEQHVNSPQGDRIYPLMKFTFHPPLPIACDPRLNQAWQTLGIAPLP